MSSKVYSTGDGATDLEPPSQQPSALPEASEEAIDFLDSLEKEELKLVLFSETLAIVSDTGEPQGELTIEVKRGKYKDNLGIMSHCLLVHALSRGFLDGVLCGNSLLGYLAKNLEPMEQHSHEYIKFPILPMERKTSMTRQDDRLVVTRTVKEGETVKTNVTSFPWNSLAGFVSSAANLVLLRVMAWRQMVPDNAYFLTLDNEGKLCHCTYQALGYQTIQVGHQEAEMFIVEQTVHSDENIPFSCQFYLLSDGHLAKRVQVGSPGCCIISKMPVLREEDEIESQPEFEKKPLEWKEDLELYLRFLDRKEQLRLSHARYLRQHPEALAAVSDFLLFLLIRQPEDVLTYAAEHFGSYSSKHQPTPYVRSSHPPSPFRVLEEEESEEVFQVEESTMDNYGDQDDQDADYADHVRDDDNDYDNDYDDDDNDDDDDNYYDDDDDDDDNDYDDDDDDDDDNDDDNDDDDDDDNDNDQDNDDDNNDNDKTDDDKTDDNKENKEELG